MSDNLKIKLAWPVKKFIKNTTEEKWTVIWDESISIDENLNISIRE